MERVGCVVGDGRRMALGCATPAIDPVVDPRDL